MPAPDITPHDEREIIEKYLAPRSSINKIAVEYHMGKKRVLAILAKHGVTLKPRGENIRKYHPANASTAISLKPSAGHKFVAVAKFDGKTFDDYENRSGCLTHYVKNTLGVQLPSKWILKQQSLHSGRRWYEEYFDIIEVDDEPEGVHCPYCNWVGSATTHTNQSIGTHLIRMHGITLDEHIRKHPQDANKYVLACPTRRLQGETDTTKYVTCQICGKKLKRIDSSHLRTHGMTKAEYILRYRSDTLPSEYRQFLAEKMAITNQSLEPRYESRGETEIREFIAQHGISCGPDRRVLLGGEIGIYIPDKRIGIEYDGLAWHSECLGKKNQHYHLNKTQRCNCQGIKLIHIFEDEWIFHKDIVKSKLCHLLRIDVGAIKIGARSCVVAPIDSAEANRFMDENHIQGGSKSTLHLGCCHGNTLVAVMSFAKRKSDTAEWELTRFATKMGYVCRGVASKLFTHFVRNWHPVSVKSFADRRWTLDPYDNLYVKLGFRLTKTLKPTYWYLNDKVARCQRIHRFRCRKAVLTKRHPELPENLPEADMAKLAGYDRIWDCGLWRYTWYA